MPHRGCRKPKHKTAHKDYGSGVDALSTVCSFGKRHPADLAGIENSPKAKVSSGNDLHVMRLFLPAQDVENPFLCPAVTANHHSGGNDRKQISVVVQNATNSS